MKKSFLFMFLFFVFTQSFAQNKLGDVASDIALLNTKDSSINLHSLKGNVVLIDFWASWCGPCRASNPGVVRLYNKYKSKGFVVFGVSIDSKKSNWLKAIKQDKITYIQVNDNAGWNSKVAAAYGVNQIPTTFLLDTDGKIVAIDLEGKLLEKKIIALLKK
jgi:peroxiredoxin